MTGPFHISRRHRRVKRSSALVVTLVVLALATILVVSLASMISVERITTHESFENQRTRELAGIAVDEVVATLHDNIPTNTIWAVAPGRLTYMNTGTFNTVLLCSGVASGTITSGTGQVDLNAPILGSSPTSYPIASPNSEYPTAPEMPVAWVEVLQDGTLIRNGVTPAETPSKSNPIVGRYAYWVDTETSKANINTAGRGQATYTFTYNTNTGAFPSGGNDLQNLTASPSRLDLSQLDGNITTNQSDATFHYTYGGYWLPDPNSGDQITIPEPNSTNIAPVYPQGMHRFNSIADWAQLPATDLITGTSVTPITNTTQIEPNKFYLTTHSRTPDLTPWGFNRLWLQGVDENAWSTGTLAFMGNRLNGKGVPAYPNSLAVATTNYPGMAEPGGASAAPDSRYYYTPYVSTNAPSQLVEASRYDNGGMQGIANFVNNMMVQLNRTDWPGFQGHSFVEKYGQKECEDLAFNILCMYDASVEAGSIADGFYLDGYNGRNYYADWRGVYGGFSLFGQDPAGNDIATTSNTQIDGTNKLLSPVGEWPYFDQVSVEFQAPAGANATGYNTASEPYPLFVTNAEPFAGLVQPLKTDTGWPTKFPDRPGFACELSSQDTATNATVSGCNVIINPSAQVVYPPGFQNTFYSGHSSGGAGRSEWAMCDISVYATGMFNGSNVVYGSPTAPDTETMNGKSNPRHIPYYYWGPCDNLYSTNSAAGPGVYGFYYDPPTNSFFGKNSQDLGYPPSLNPLIEIDSSTGTQTAQKISFQGPYNNQSSIFIGPFSYGTIVTDIQFRARFVELNMNVHTATVPVEIAPLAYNFPSGWYPLTGGTANEFFSPSYANEAETFNNVAGTTGANGQAYSPTFLFEVKQFLLGPANEVGQNITYEISDPRAYRYTNQWTMRGPDPSGIENTPGSYKSSYTDGLTGITGDSSKFAWPNLGMAYYNSSYEGQNLALTTPTPPPWALDPRFRQSGNNIQGFPGVGWLSLLPLNSEAGQGNGSDDPNAPGKPVPWRTLSLEANQKAGTRVPDWLLLEAFDVAYDQTFCSHTEGKLNVNTSISSAFPSGTSIAPRTKPLAALIDPSSYPSAGSLTLAPMSASTLTSITNAIAGGPGSTYAGLPSDIFMYPGQLCELGLQSSTGTTQLQRESLMRDLIGTLTTQSSDFLVHVVAQSVKQVNFNSTVNPVTDLQVTSEQRASALVSRLPNLGPDNIPDSGWTNPAQNFSSALADENVTTGVTNTIASMTSSTVTTNWITSAPTFRYTVSDLQYANGQ